MPSTATGFSKMAVPYIEVDVINDENTYEFKLGKGVVVLVSNTDGKVNLIAMATDGAMKNGAHAGNLIKGIAGLVGGGGGGRPNMAQAGGKNPAGIPDAIAKVAEVLADQVK